MCSPLIVSLLGFLCLLNLSICNPVPGSSGSSVFRVFYEKPDVNGIQAKLIQITNPQPVVDTLKESEKCCNTQQHLVGKKFLGAYEKLSSSLANFVQVPKATADKVGATVTVVLNNVGSKIVGFQ